MKVFLTGSTGLLGINTVHALLNHGHEVVALVRDTKKAARVLPDSSHITVVSGDIESSEPWIEKLRGIDALIHAAAYFREYFGRGDHEAKLQELNVEHPVQLVEAAAKFGLKKVMVVSSSGVMNRRSDGTPTDETDPPRAKVAENRYMVSKVRMEEALQKVKSPIPLIIVRPGWMFGPNDYAPTGAGQLVREIVQKGSLQMVGGTPMCICDARDVAEGMVLALEKSETSTIYNLAGNPLRAIDALREVAQQSGRAKIQGIPMPVALAMSGILEVVSRLTGQPNPIPRIGLLTVSDGVLISSEKAIRELGVRFRPFSETAHDTIAFFKNDFAA